MGKDELFKEFDTANYKLWKEQIIADLKGKDYEESLVWKDENNIAHQPFYTANCLINVSLSESISASQKKTAEWESLEVFSADDDRIHQQIETNLSNGLDYAFIKNSSDYKESSKFEVQHSHQLYYLIENVNLHRLPKRFLIDPIREILKNKPEGKKDLEALSEVFKLRLNDLKPDHFLMVDGSIYKNAGATIVQELAYTLQHATEYLDRLTSLGFTAEYVARSFIYKLGFGTTYFTEIAKGRAFNYLIQQLYQHYQISNTPIIWGEASTYYHSHKDAYTNLLRLTSQGMSMVLGNCNLIQLPAFNAIENATDTGRRLSKNISLILKDESFFSQVRDMSAGAYYIENLTTEIVEKAWDLFLKLESKGSIITQFENGDLVKQLNQSHHERLKHFKDDKKVMLGVNKHPNANSKDLKSNLTNLNGIPSRILATEI